MEVHLSRWPALSHCFLMNNNTTKYCKTAMYNLLSFFFQGNSFHSLHWKKQASITKPLLPISYERPLFRTVVPFSKHKNHCPVHGARLDACQSRGKRWPIYLWPQDFAKSPDHLIILTIDLRILKWLSVSVLFFLFPFMINPKVCKNRKSVKLSWFLIHGVVSMKDYSWHYQLGTSQTIFCIVFYHKRIHLIS